MFVVLKVVKNELYSLDVDKMKYGQCSGEETGIIRRITTGSYVESVKQNLLFATHWRWYWLDDSNEWQLFEVHRIHEYKHYLFIIVH
jgi:hypothetical protein